MNHGLEEERARDLFYSLWISDKFMNAVQNDSVWHLFCPKDVPMLQNSYGEEFEKHYNEAVDKGLSRKKIQQGHCGIKLFPQMETGTYISHV